jgi:3-oxoacyl-[acyl-carrier protein] reductase
VLGLTRGLARELGRNWIRVNSVAPSAVETEGTREFFGESKDRALDVIAKQQSLRRTLDPSDVAGTIVYLMSDASTFVTGQTLMVDGGTVST